AFNEAIERWKTLNDFGLHAENLSTLPAVRLKNLARYAGMTSVNLTTPKMFWRFERIFSLDSELSTQYKELRTEHKEFAWRH
ncbi:hypothetical protein, partial [Klebsiella pneumoniae]|uniref:hypothetical protein n=1 Tax=Klebsiella pneumoniae TaxID=573 RepID=UPI0018A2E270